MNIALELDEFDETNVYFNKPVRNTVIDESNFLRVTYSNNMFSMNGVYIKVNIEVYTKKSITINTNAHSIFQRII